MATGFGNYAKKSITKGSTYKSHKVTVSKFGEETDNGKTNKSISLQNTEWAMENNPLILKQQPGTSSISLEINEGFELATDTQGPPLPPHHGKGLSFWNDDYSHRGPMLIYWERPKSTTLNHQSEDQACDTCSFNSTEYSSPKPVPIIGKPLIIYSRIEKTVKLVSLPADNRLLYENASNSSDSNSEFQSEISSDSNSEFQSEISSDSNLEFESEISTPTTWLGSDALSTQSQSDSYSDTSSQNSQPLSPGLLGAPIPLASCCFSSANKKIELDPVLITLGSCSAETVLSWFILAVQFSFVSFAVWVVLDGVLSLIQKTTQPSFGIFAYIVATNICLIVGAVNVKMLCFCLFVASFGYLGGYKFLAKIWHTLYKPTFKTETRDILDVILFSDPLEVYYV